MFSTQSSVAAILPAHYLAQACLGGGRGGAGWVDCKITEAATCFTTLSCIGIKHSLGSQPKYLFLLQQGHQHYLYHSIINIIFTVSIHRRDYFLQLSFLFEFPDLAIIDLRNLTENISNLTKYQEFSNNNILCTRTDCKII